MTSSSRSPVLGCDPSPSPSDLVLGVDGGGTKTLAWLAARLAAPSAPPLGIGQAGPGNPRSVGFEAAQANIAAAVAAAFEAAHLSPVCVGSACLGLAGAGRESEQVRVRDWALARGLAQHVRVTHDAEIILAAGTSLGVGVALICGTGSFAWGRQAAGETARAGGWGYLLGDEGSGYHLALRGLQAAVRSADGRGPATALLERFQQRLDAAAPQDLIEAVYHPDMSRERLAELATIVFELAESDAVAASLVHEAAGELALMATTLVRRLRFPPGAYELALAGGVLVRQLRLQEELLRALAAAGAPPAAWQVVADPVRGAVALARTLHRPG